MAHQKLRTALLGVNNSNLKDMEHLVGNIFPTYLSSKDKQSKAKLRSAQMTLCLIQMGLGFICRILGLAYHVKMAFYVQTFHIQIREIPVT